MAVGEALTNLVWAKIDDLEQVKCSANWMWAPKLAGEGAALRDAAEAMADGHDRTRHGRGRRQGQPVHGHQGGR